MLRLKSPLVGRGTKGIAEGWRHSDLSCQYRSASTGNHTPLKPRVSTAALLKRPPRLTVRPGPMEKFNSSHRMVMSRKIPNNSQPYVSNWVGSVRDRSRTMASTPRAVW